MESDKRKDPRLDFGITILHDGNRGMTRNISTSGTFIRIDELNNRIPLASVGSDITFSLDFPITEDYIEVEGTIMHHGNNDGMGIQFKKIDGKDKEFIKEFILDYT